MDREEQLLIELAGLQENPLNIDIPEKFAQEVFEQLKGSDDFMEYLRLTMGTDMKRYFSVSTERERDQIKGHFALASFLRGKIKTIGG
jgi:hypothetical protein